MAFNDKPLTIIEDACPKCPIGVNQYTWQQCGGGDIPRLKRPEEQGNPVIIAVLSMPILSGGLQMGLVIHLFT
jgi:hypothetical protein